MKFVVTVDLEDLYAEYDDERGASFNESIKEEIIHRAKRHALELIKKETSDTIGYLTVQAIEESKKTIIDDVIYHCVHSEKVKKRYSSNEEISLADYIKEELTRTFLSEGEVRKFLDKQIKDMAEKLSKELKDRYDILFASQIVTRLNEQGFLNQDVAKILLGGQS